MTGSLLEREIVLATGAAVPLLEAATTLLTLDLMLHGSPEDREQVAALRAASLTGAAVEEKHAAALLERGLIHADDRRVERVARHMVLAAVRGQQPCLHLVSPFTAVKDEAMANLILSAMKTQGFLAPGQVAELLVPPGDDGLGAWTRRVQKPGPGNGYGSPN